MRRLLNAAQIRRNYSIKPVGLRWRSSNGFITTAVGMGLFTDLFLYSLFVPILPFLLADRAGVPYDQIQTQVSSLLSAYAGASVIASPIVGALTDRLGTRRVPFLTSLLVLGLSLVLLLLSRTTEMMLVARVLQGLSAAVVWTNGLALCFETVGSKGLGKAVGAIFGCITMGNLLAPTLGGVLYYTGGTAAVFAVAFSLLAIDFVMRLLVIEVQVARLYQSDMTSEQGDERSPPPATAESEYQDMVPGQLHNQDESDSLLPVREGALDSYKLSPNLPRLVRLFPIAPCLTNRRLVAALAIAFVQAVIVGSFDATLPIVSQEYFNLTSLHAGLMFLPIGVANLAFGHPLGRCVDRFGSRKVATTVYLYLVPIFLSFRVVVPGGPKQLAVHAVLLGLAGVGVAGMGAPSVVEASTVVEKYHQANPAFFGKTGPWAQLYSLSYLFFSLGLTLGPELAGGLRQAIGYGNMNAVLAGICLVASLTCLFCLGEKRKIYE